MVLLIFLTKRYDLYWPPCWMAVLFPSNMATKTIFCLYLVKRLILTLRCTVNVTTSSFQHFTYECKIFVQKLSLFIFLKIIFWSRQVQNYSFLKKWSWFEKQNHYILFKT